jgi:hypothetical protein
VDEEESRRLEQHIYPRPPEDIIDRDILRGFRKPEDRLRIRCPDFHTDRLIPFRCGCHNYARDDPPVPVVELKGIDGKTYRVGQCRRCGRMFWGVKGDKSPVTGPWLQ